MNQVTISSYTSFITNQTYKGVKVIRKYGVLYYICGVY